MAFSTMLALSKTGAFWGLAATALGISGLVVVVKRFRRADAPASAPHGVAPADEAVAPAAPAASTGPGVREFCIVLNRVLDLPDARDEHGRPRMPEAGFIYGMLEMLRAQRDRREAQERSWESLSQRVETLSAEVTALRDVLTAMQLQAARNDEAARMVNAGTAHPAAEASPATDFDAALIAAASTAITPLEAAFLPASGLAAPLEPSPPAEPQPSGPDPFDPPPAEDSIHLPAVNGPNVAEFRELCTRADALHRELTLQTVKLESIMPDAAVLIDQIDERLRRLSQALADGQSNGPADRPPQAVEPLPLPKTDPAQAGSARDEDEASPSATCEMVSAATGPGAGRHA